MTISVGGSKAKQHKTLTTLQRFNKHILKHFHFFQPKILNFFSGTMIWYGKTATNNIHRY
jgi:hypothetical protein